MLWRRRWILAGACLVALGVALRVREFAINPSLWLDESSLALNILTRSFAELARPLSYAQAAPIFFLWLERAAVVSMRSSSEFALRLVPLLAGCLACALFWLLCRRAGAGRLGSACATGLFALSPQLIDYSHQAKQYSTDVLAAVCVYLAGLMFLRRGGAALYCAVGLGAMGLSHPAVFVLGGVGTTILADSWIRKDRKKLMAQAGVAAVWLGGFAVNYFVSLRHLSRIPGMTEYWAKTHDAFLPLTFRAPLWLVHSPVEAAGNLGFPALVLAGLAVLGTVALWRRDWRVPVMLHLPAVLAAAASGLAHYPFADRAVLFLAPALLLSAGASILAAGWMPRARWLRPVMAAMLLVAAAPALKIAWSIAAHPERFGREEFRDTYLEAARSGQCPAHIFVSQTAASHYRYYSRFRWAGGPPASILAESETEAALAGVPCFWLVSAHISERDRSAFSGKLAERGYEKTAAARERAGAHADLFERREPAGLGN